MAEERLGASFSIDVTNLKAGLAQANRLIKESQSEFKAAAAGMDDWSTSQDGLTAKIKSLNDITEIQRKKVDALEGEYDSLIAGGLDPASKAAVDLRTKINNEKAALAANEKELQKQQKALEELESSSDDASEAVEDVGEAAKESGDGFTIAKGAIADLISSGLQKLVGACSNAVKSLWGLGDSTTEYRQGLNQLETAFGKVGMSAEETYQAFNYFGSVLGDTKKAQETMLMLGQLVDTEKELESWTDTLTGVFATYGQAIPLEGLTEAINHTSRLGKVQGNLADALEWGGVSVDDFNANLANLTDEGDRAAYIQETLNGLYGEAAEQYNILNKDILDASTASTDFENAQAKLGDKIRPLQTQIKAGFAKILEAVSNLLDGVDWEGFSVKIENAFSTFIEDVLPKIIDGFKWISDNKDYIIGAISGIAAGFAVFKGVPAVITAVNTVMSILNGTMALNPIGIVALAIGGLVAAFVVLWKKCDWFRNFWINLWDGIKSFTKSAIDFLKKFFTETIPQLVEDVVTWFSELPTKIGEFFSDIISKAISWGADMISKARETASNFVSNVVNWFSQLPTRLWTWLTAVIGKVVSWGADLAKKGLDAAQELFNNIVDTVSELPDEMLSIGKNVVEGIWEGISNGYTWITNKIKGWVGDVLGFIKKSFGIASPSKLMRDEVGKYLALGVGEGFSENMDAVKRQISEATQIAGVSSVGGVTSSSNGTTQNGKAGVVNVYQTNNFSQAHSRLELYKTRQQTAAAVRLVTGGTALA